MAEVLKGAFPGPGASKAADKLAEAVVQLETTIAAATPPLEDLRDSSVGFPDGSHSVKIHTDVPKEVVQSPVAEGHGISDPHPGPRPRPHLSCAVQLHPEQDDYAIS